MLRLVSIPLIRELAFLASLLMCALSGPTAGAWVLCVGEGSHVAIEAASDSDDLAAPLELHAGLSNEAHCRDIPLLRNASVPAQPVVLSRSLDGGLLIAVLWPAMPERVAPPLPQNLSGDDPLGLRLAAHQSVVLLI